MQNGLQAPAFERLESSPSSLGARLVYGSVRLKGVGAKVAAVQAHVETGEGTGEYLVVFEDANETTKLSTRAFFFAVPAECRYRFSRGNPGNDKVVEAVLNYGYVDL